MKIGVSLLSALWQGVDGKGLPETKMLLPATEQLDYYAAKGFSQIRLPIDWENIQHSLGGALNQSIVSQLHKFIEHAAINGQQVILDIHNYGKYRGDLIGSAAVPTSAFVNLWARLGAEFAGEKNVVFALMNEPQQTSSHEWLGIVNAAIEGIRSTGASQEILISGLYWDGASSWTKTDNATVLGAPGAIKDSKSNYAFEVHQYLDDTSGQHEWVVSNTIGSERLVDVTTWARATGNKLYLGEFGVAKNPMAIAALEDMTKFLAKNEDVWSSAIYWAAGALPDNYIYRIDTPTLLLDSPQMEVLSRYVTPLDGGPSLKDVYDHNGKLISRTLFNADGIAEKAIFVVSANNVQIRTYDGSGVVFTSKEAHVSADMLPHRTEPSDPVPNAGSAPLDSVVQPVVTPPANTVAGASGGSTSAVAPIKDDAATIINPVVAGVAESKDGTLVVGPSKTDAIDVPRSGSAGSAESNATSTSTSTTTSDPVVTISPVGVVAVDSKGSVAVSDPSKSDVVANGGASGVVNAGNGSPVQTVDPSKSDVGAVFNPANAVAAENISHIPVAASSRNDSVGVLANAKAMPSSGLQTGTSGNDVLISTNTGNSTLSGGAGNDTYLVYSLGDVVVDGVDQGNDILYTTVSYSLGENQVEAMSVADQITTGAINLIGNYVSQIIVGNYGDNVLNGGSGGVDTLIGLFGNDTYSVGDARTVIVEQAGQGSDTAVTSVSYTLGAGVSVEVFAAQNAASTTGLRLGGNELAQTIAGTAGADTIAGGGGRDVLLGGAGADTFVIGTVATGNVAVLADFVAGTDRIGLTSTAFNVGTSLDAAEFVAGTAATTADQRVIYDAGTGQLFYDADGNGAGAAVLFAQVVPGTAITAASFDVVVPTATIG
jgi:Ca2+-binding RTX toxin-like protein